MTERKLPKTIMYRGREYHLLDVQYSKSNADLASQILSSGGPKNAKWVIRCDHYKTEGGKHNCVYGIYTTSKVTVERKGK